MESIPVDTLAAILAGDGVGRSFWRHGLVEDGVEACIVSCLGKSPHHVADQSDRLGVVQWCKRHRLLQIPQDLFGDSLMLAEGRSGMHYPVANRVNRRHAVTADRIFQQRHRIFFGCIFRLRDCIAQLPPLGIAKGEPESGSAHATDFAGK